MRRSLAALAAATFLIAGVPTSSSADQIGLLDPLFGGDGKVVTDLGPPGAIRSVEDSANAVVIQADGKIVVAGSLGCRQNIVDTECSIAVARYDTDGTLDPSFSEDGVVLTHFASGAVGWDVALQTDGKIVVAGAAYGELARTWQFAVARYETDGTPDATFSGNGRATTVFVSRGFSSLALQTDGKIVVAGSGIVRFETDGSVDTGFGAGGYVTSPSMTDVAIQPDEKIVTSGGKFRVYRYVSDGTPDATFGLDGKATVAPATGSVRAHSLALQPNGSIVVAGAFRDAQPTRRFALARFTSAGEIDHTFAGDGLVTTRIGGQYALARSVALQPDGRIVVAGGAWYGSVYQDNAEVSSFAVARFNRGGALDQRFSGDGKIVTYVGGGFPFEQATSVALQADDAIVVAGEAGRNGGDFGIVRLVIPASRPDALIKQRSGPFFIGDDDYGPPLWRQTWNAVGRHGASFLIRAQHDGSAPDRFVFDGCSPTNSFTVRYFVGDSPVTRRVAAGTFQVGPIAPGHEFELRVVIRERTPSTDNDRLVCRIAIHSANDADRMDLVRAIVYVGPVGCFPEGIRGYRQQEIRGCEP
jgi:uncharacterized delta-60 repeat protein